MSNLDQELEAVLTRRKKVTEAVERLKGRKEQAQSNLEQIEEECRAKKIDPSKIDEVIQQLEDKYKNLIEELDRDTQEAERSLAPFVGGSSTP
jgi:uncharacterized protein YfcZ (UPF0381/DUF406 family)